MGIFSRAADIINSNINALLDRAEDPEKMIKLVISKIEDTIIELRTSCASTMASRSGLSRQIDEAQALVQRWENRAEMAVQKGLDDLACEALLEKKKALVQLESLKRSEKHLDEMIQGYREDIAKLEDKLQGARMKYQTIKEKMERAREQEKVSKASYRASSYETMAKFDKMEDRIDRMTAERQMRDETDSAEKHFREMEEMEEVKKELEELKARLAAAEGKKK